jgi:hypothetical protein
MMNGCLVGQIPMPLGLYARVIRPAILQFRYLYVTGWEQVVCRYLYEMTKLHTIHWLVGVA